MKSAPNFRIAFGLELRDSRKAANLSQEELAFRSELHRTYISLLERGLKTPTLEAFFRLCEALEQNPADFINRLNKRILQ